ncbi:MAG TPA: PPK2 family polyphosphate kinase [Mycobacteriales bacterium]|nr:PPK2 family polyphosphate kinase [Mycobacteriales bacterium]
MAISIRSRLVVSPGDESIVLAGRDPRDDLGLTRKAAEQRASGDAERLAELQERLYAEGARSVLLVLQGMDTSGKGGAIKHVAGRLNPLGLRLKAFKAPTSEELRHHYLWRVRRELPRPGEIGVFDRSHYEDVLVVRVRGLVAEDVWSRRYDEINRFEAKAAEAGTVIVKCFLHLSYDEQRERLLARLDEPTKRWKFRAGDLDERAHWTAYHAAYETALARCSTALAPWYVVPADRKWVRNHAISALLLETLAEMAPAYPAPDLDLAALRTRLEAPG